VAHFIHQLYSIKPTQGYQRAGLVTSEELTLIKRVDRQPKAKIESVLLSEGSTYTLLYLNLLKKLQRVDTMQCLLVLIADALAGASPPSIISALP
jgi:V-type H+-transporting ATPase subunit H